jgi:hypothetical protein
VELRRIQPGRATRENLTKGTVQLPVAFLLLWDSQIMLTAGAFQALISIFINPALMKININDCFPS